MIECPKCGAQFDLQPDESPDGFLVVGCPRHIVVAQKMTVLRSPDYPLPDITG